MRVHVREPADVDAQTPVIVYLNPPSWWDPLFGFLLAFERFPDRDHFAPIDADALEKYGFLARLGLVSARGFDPEQPVERPVRALAPLSAGYVWGQAELERFELAALRGLRPRLPFAAAIAADALLSGAAVIDVLQRSGCDELLIDFDTLGGPTDSRPIVLAGLVKQLRRRGFAVHGIFTLGQDHDDVGCFERLVEWAEAEGLMTVDLRLWTPDPSSALVRELAREDRVRHRALDRWDGAHVVVAPKQMSAQTLYRGWVWAQRRLCSLASIWRRRPGVRAAWPAYLAAVLAATLAPFRARARVRDRLLPVLGC